MTKEEMEKQIHDFTKLMYKTGYEDGVVETEKINDKAHDDGYNKGLYDAWECAKMLRHPSYDGALHDNEKKDIFGYISSDEVLTHYTASEAIFAIKEYKEKHTDKQIKQWDEICGKDEPQNKLIVIGIGAWGDWHCVDNEGHVFKLGDEYKKCWKKTGKSYPELANILDQLNKVESEKEE